MRNDPALLSLLCCPTCWGDLDVSQADENAVDGHIIRGKLKCAGRGATYPILGGVPRFLPDQVTDEVLTTVEGFGYQWQHASPTAAETRFTAAETFLDFIEPVKPDYFEGKIVLDGGCGSGRFTYWAQQFGASVIVGVDLSDSVFVAFQKTRHLPNALIIQADLFRLPLRQCFDYVFSVGVLHHTADPRGAFDALVTLVKPGGGISAWVYGQENNGWIIRFVNPLRRHITSRLPRPVLQTLAYLITIPLFLILKGVYRPVGSKPHLARLRKYLFYFDYLYFLSAFGFREQALIVLDHLIPTLAEYIPRAQFAQWFTENALCEVTITSRAGNSWRGFGVRAAAG